MAASTTRPAKDEPAGFRVRTERCASCLYTLKYPKDTRDRILGDVAANDGFVQCHTHDLAAKVCCRGYFDAVGENGGSPVQLAIRFTRLGFKVIEDVTPEMYPPGEEDEDDDDE